MTDDSYSTNPSDDDGTPTDGVDLNRTPLAGAAFGSSASGYDPSALRVDLYGNPVDRNPYFPDPNNPNLDMGQVLYHMAFGAKPEDFHPALQPLARGFSIAFQPKPPLGPGLLGSAADIRAAVASKPAEADQASGDGEDDEINSRIDPAPPTKAPFVEQAAARLSDRDRSYLDRYYDAVAKYANQYKVNPSFPLGLGIESTFGSGGTYLDTGDAFGMTGGSTAHMTHAASPEENARVLFDLYGRQMYGVGDDVDAFINAMQGRNAKGQPVPGWRTYNSKHAQKWENMARSGIDQMKRDLPAYLPSRALNVKTKS
jgi:hypothetical protein